MFFFCILLNFSLSAVFGFDYGYNSIKVSTATEKHLLSWALNSISKRINPQYFALWTLDSDKNNNNHITNNNSIVFDENNFHNYDWVFGEHAKTKCMKKPELCIVGNPLFKEEVYNSADVETFAAASIKYVYESILKAEEMNDTYPIKAAFSIPSSFKTKQKLDLLKALSLANIDVVQFVPNHIATAEIYAIERTSLFSQSEKEKIVMFLDIGAKGTRISVFSFSYPNNTITVKELSYLSDEEFGGNNIDQMFYDQIVKEQNITFTKNRDNIRFLEQIKNTKELLTLHETRNLTYEYDEKTIHYEITRENLLMLCKNFSDNLVNMIHKAKEDAKSKLNDNNIEIDSIELVGGSTRLPFIQDLVLGVLPNLKKVSHSVDADSSVCMGSGYFAIHRSPEYSVKDMKHEFILRDKFIVSINHEKNFTIFDKTENPEAVSSLHIDLDNKNDKLFVDVYGDDDGTLILSFILHLTGKEKSIDIDFIYSNFMLPYPLKATADGKVIVFQITHAALSRERYDALIDAAQSRRAHEEAKNTFETVLFKVKNKISKFKQNTTVEQQAIKAVKEIEEWIAETEKEGATTEDYLNGIQRLKDETKQARNVYKQQKLSSKFKGFKEFIKENHEKVINEISQNNNKYNETVVKQLQNQLEEIRSWVKEVEGKRINKKQFKKVYKEYHEIADSVLKNKPIKFNPEKDDNKKEKLLSI